MSWLRSNYEITAEATAAWNEQKGLDREQPPDPECDLSWHYRNSIEVGACDCEEVDRDRLDDR